MSTNINITVGDNALLERAQQQAAANRQAQLNREASTRLEAQATAARTAAFAAQGRDANGNLLTGAPFTQPQIDRRPAANRVNQGQWSHYFPAEPSYTVFVGLSSNTYTSIGPIRQSSRPTTKQFELRSDTTSDGSRSNPLSFQSAGGPNGGPYFRSLVDIRWQDLGFAPDGINTVGPLRRGPVGLTMETDIRVSRPDPSWRYTLFGSFAVYTYTPVATFLHLARFDVDAVADNAYQVATGVGTGGPEQTSVLIDKPSDWLSTWTRIALISTAQDVKLFVGGEQVVTYAIPTPIADFPSRAFASFTFIANVGDNVNPSAYLDSPGLILNDRSLYSANYTPSPLRY